ncbi:hypothetical protein [Paenibacillus thiaminolyticus]|uniref:hypothetical protein n=1 Tax=Paenibacillus thiaminolyticus TaxID=49283 RepID=UPI002542E5DB|nr:hypothetical protein [Paenibacillus thiaminolyticus]WII39670.1 hypothetical protein O0V01_11490 [Paenibacillus thiaminolyticus]
MIAKATQLRLKELKTQLEKLDHVQGDWLCVCDEHGEMLYQDYISADPAIKQRQESLYTFTRKEIEKEIAFCERLLTSAERKVNPNEH